MLFPGGIEATPNATLIMSAGAAVIYAVIVNTRPTLARTVVKTLAVALLAVLAIVENGPLLLFGGLALSAVGDAFLSRDGDRAFLGGLASFSLPSCSMSACSSRRAPAATSSSPTSGGPSSRPSRVSSRYS